MLCPTLNRRFGPYPDITQPTVYFLTLHIGIKGGAPLGEMLS
jgi:hypothetical protein